MTFDLTNKNHEDLIFASDGYYCGRGFKAVYEQIPCSGYPGIPGFPMTTPPPGFPEAECSRTLQDRSFVLEVYGRDRAPCVFNIIKTDPVSITCFFLVLTFL